MGKTSILLRSYALFVYRNKTILSICVCRYIRGEYDDKQISTLQASYLDKKIVVDNKAVQVCTTKATALQHAVT